MLVSLVYLNGAPMSITHRKEKLILYSEKRERSILFLMIEGVNVAYGGS